MRTLVVLAGGSSATVLSPVSRLASVPSLQGRAASSVGA